MSTSVRHVLSLSGGKDSAALAIYLRDRVPEMEYIFHDTDKELPETHEYLARLEALLGKRIAITTPEHSFDHWLTVFGGMIPSNHRRWCTRLLKLRPFERYVGDDQVVNYIGLRADEDRKGYLSSKPNITPVYPFRDDGLVRKDIFGILEESGLGLPKYTDWGRTRSGCFFCFYQQKMEWVCLLRKYPKRFKQARDYEHANMRNGNPFYWSGSESLDELQRPERIEAIERQWKLSQENARASAANRPLVSILGEMDYDESEPEGCLICSL